MKMRKNKIILLTHIVALSTVFFMGCSAESQDLQHDFKDLHRPDNSMNMPAPPDGMKDFGTPNDASYVALDVDKDKLYSNRDLEANPDLTDTKTLVAEDNSNYIIQSEGAYIITGEAKNYTVQIEADKKDKVQLVLDGAKITNDNFPVIYVKSADKCFINLCGDNELSVTGDFTSDGETKTDAVVFSKVDLTINGLGELTIVSGQGNGIAAKDDLVIASGKYTITCKKDAIEANESIAICDGEFKIDSESDGIQSDTCLVIDGGSFDISSGEGLEATYIQINGGVINIYASDDGINATNKCDSLDVVIEVNDGTVNVEAGPGDTDGFDSNGVIIVNGGSINVKGQSAFDYNRGAAYNGGSIIINGEAVNEIPESMMGGFGGRKK